MSYMINISDSVITSHIICFYIHVGVFKAPEQVDIFVDLKKISQLYSTVVSY